MPEIEMSKRLAWIDGTIADPMPRSVISTLRPRIVPTAVARSASMPTRAPLSSWKLIGGVKSVATFMTPALLMAAGSLSASAWLKVTPGNEATSAFMASAAKAGGAPHEASIAAASRAIAVREVFPKRVFMFDPRSVRDPLRGSIARTSSPIAGRKARPRSNCCKVHANPIGRLYISSNAL